jgi:hypothetical protein
MLETLNGNKDAGTVALVGDCLSRYQPNTRRLTRQPLLWNLFTPSDAP